MKHTWRRTVTLFLVGQAITLFGTMITGHAISWYVTLKTQSGALLTLFTVSMMVGSLAMPLGMLIFGPLADVVSIDWLLIGTGVGIMLLGICVVASKTLRQAGLLPKPPDESPAETPTE
jgi:DHA3 family macrolide efflux protein-like MFS transporter